MRIATVIVYITCVVVAGIAADKAKESEDVPAAAEKKEMKENAETAQPSKEEAEKQETKEEKKDGASQKEKAYEKKEVAETKPSEKNAVSNKAGKKKAAEMQGAQEENVKQSKEGSAELEVARASICENVVNHEPKGKSNAFPADVGKVYCFSHIKGAKDSVTVLHKWYKDGKAVGSVPLSVWSPSFRTYSLRAVEPGSKGTWRVEIIDGETGAVMKDVSFSIE